ncbi:hypothetical protein [Sphingopyxis sp. YF1]|uniref:DUF6932 family protein n=1 Tax=Sphingopyxis sp. YF1 TaxID=2482763 RepID=UPI001F619691|nr:hypothetical protein [Sphingopyxis sp. YF1]
MDEDVVGQFAPRSPYQSTMSEFVVRFATSPERAAILRGFLEYREGLRQIGFVEGFQWIDGSFVEACEQVNGRPPGDVDVVSVVHRPVAHAAEQDWLAFLDQHGDTLLDQAHCKVTYSCDSYFIDLDIPQRMISEQTAYWFGLFSHQRDTFRWKGLVQLDIQCDDQIATEALEEIEAAGW